jgi:hypothetical protein
MKYYKRGEVTNAIRVGGNFTCKHRPWLNGFENDLLPEEMAKYKEGQKSSTWIQS